MHLLSETAVDDVFSSGQNIHAVLTRLQKYLKSNMPREIRIATIWKKPGQNKGELQPDFCLYDTNEWLVFPYELTGLTIDEIKAHKPYAAKFINTK